MEETADTMQGDSPRFAAETSAALSETTVPSPRPNPAPLPPYRQIRALHDVDTITVYQAYKSSIATAAVRTQKLNASPDFSPRRMTWVKPSWCWMMYRSGYAAKDARQDSILAIKMRHDDFVGLLRRAELTHGRGQETKVEEGRSGPENEEDDQESGGAEEKRVEEESAQQDGGTEDAEPNRLDSSVRRGLKPPSQRRRSRLPKSSKVKVQWDPERSPSLEKLPYRSIQIGIPAALSSQWVEEWIVGIEDVTHTAQELKKFLDENPRVTTAELVRRGLMPTETEYAVPDDVQGLLGMRDRLREGDDR